MRGAKHFKKNHRENPTWIGDFAGKDDRVLFGDLKHLAGSQERRQIRRINFHLAGLPGLCERQLRIRTHLAADVILA